MPDITVFPADLTDAAHADGIVHCLDAYAIDPMGGSKPLTDHVRDTLVAGLRDTPAARVWLAQDDESQEFVGVVVAFVGYSTFAAKPRWNVHDVSVVPAIRGRGVGRKLLEAVIAAATEAGCSAVTLEVRHDNEPARHLYASLGFGDDFAPMAFWTRPIE
jgi:ribosomal protein S18 acetylase RimI-like enzyme